MIKGGKRRRKRVGSQAAKQKDENKPSDSVVVHRGNDVAAGVESNVSSMEAKKLKIDMEESLWDEAVLGASVLQDIVERKGPEAGSSDAFDLDLSSSSKRN